MIENGPSSAIRAFATQLMGAEIDNLDPDGVPLDSASCRVFDKLRTPIYSLSGALAFRSLLTRSLSLATREDSRLEALSIDNGGTLNGLMEQEAVSAALLLAHLLNLLITFIGEPLTLRLLQEAWPELTSFDVTLGERNRNGRFQ